MIFRSRRRLLVAFGVLLSAAVALGFLREALLIEPDSLVVAEYSIDLPGWPASLDGFRITAVGDVHAGAPYMDERKLQEVVRRITAARPDLIAWLGDYVIEGVKGGTFMAPERIASILARAEARFGQVAIIGNHDRWLDSYRVEQAFRSSGIPFLRFSSREIVVKDTRLHLFGLDDFELVPGYWATFNLAAEGWKKLPPDEPLIVLSHNPDVFPWIPARVTLTLASHTHGGQVRLPLVGSLVVPSTFGQRFARGLIVEQGRSLFVNTGLGTSIIPIRFGVPPEISVLTLRRARDH